MDHSPYYIQSLGNAIKVIEAFEQKPHPLTIADIVAISKVNRGSVNRIVRTLLEDGWLRCGNQTYSLSERFAHLFLAYKEGSTLLQSTQAAMRELAAKYHEIVMIYGITDWETFIIDFDEPSDATYHRWQITDKLPLNCTTIGKLFLSQYSDRVITQVIKERGFFKITEKSLVNCDDLIKSIHQTRQNGYAVCDGEFTAETGALGIPIYDENRKIVFAMNLCYSSLSEAKKKNIILDMLKISRSVSYYYPDRP